MRSLVLLLLGLFLGAAFAFVFSRGLAQREAYPRGVMNVMQHHLAELKRLERAGRCAEGEVRPHFERIAALAQDVPAASPIPAASRSAAVASSVTIRTHVVSGCGWSSGTLPVANR